MLSKRLGKKRNESDIGADRRSQLKSRAWDTKACFTLGGSHVQGASLRGPQQPGMHLPYSLKAVRARHPCLNSQEGLHK